MWGSGPQIVRNRFSQLMLVSVLSTVALNSVNMKAWALPAWTFTFIFNTCEDHQLLLPDASVTGLFLVRQKNKTCNKPSFSVIFLSFNFIYGMQRFYCRSTILLLMLWELTRIYKKEMNVFCIWFFKRVLRDSESVPHCIFTSSFVLHNYCEIILWMKNWDSLKG